MRDKDKVFWSMFGWAYTLIDPCGQYFYNIESLLLLCLDLALFGTSVPTFHATNPYTHSQHVTYQLSQDSIISTVQEISGL
jgi:hypothetical protein